MEETERGQVLPWDGGDGVPGVGEQGPCKKMPPETAARARYSLHRAVQCHCLPLPQTLLQLPPTAKRNNNHCE